MNVKESSSSRYQMVIVTKTHCVWILYPFSFKKKKTDASKSVKH